MAEGLRQAIQIRHTTNNWETQSENRSFKNILTKQMCSELYFFSLLQSKHEVTACPEEPDQGLLPYLASLTNQILHKMM